MDLNKPMVTIRVTTYNHENYIREALDSILMQEVDFKYDVIIGEDCSPDNTRAILKEYESKYPQIFKVIYRDENIGSRENSQDLWRRATGKYVATLEGDDFWTTKDKLQKQVDFLETHSDVIATAHRIMIVNKFGDERKDIKYPECLDKWYSWKHYRNKLLPGQSASIVCRNLYSDKQYNTDLMASISKSMPGDRAFIVMLLMYGKIFCFDQVMSAYRYITDEGTSYSATVAKEKSPNPFLQIDFYKALLNYINKVSNDGEAKKNVESMLMFYTAYYYFKYNNVIDLNTVKSVYMTLENKIVAIKYTISRLVYLPIRKIRNYYNPTIGI